MSLTLHIALYVVGLAYTVAATLVATEVAYDHAEPYGHLSEPMFPMLARFVGWYLLAVIAFPFFAVQRYLDRRAAW